MSKSLKVSLSLLILLIFALLAVVGLHKPFRDLILSAMKVQRPHEAHQVHKEEVPAKEAEKPSEEKALYHCPMHPTYVSDKPGSCPICGMKLVKIEKEEKAETVKIGEDLELAPVRITPQKQQLIGVKTAPVELRPMEKLLRTVGRVDYNEEKIALIHTKFDGWIEKKLFVDFTGQLVKRGQPLLNIYSPDLVSTQEEYLLALETLEKVKNSPIPETMDGAKRLVEASKKRLLLWNITEEQIKELERTREAKIHLTLYSPIEGFVIRKSAFEGLFVTPAMELYALADLSTVWVFADLYEYEVPMIKMGQKATISLSYYPGEDFEGKVAYIYPYLEMETRTNKVRFDFRNPGYRLKPGMYANVEVKIDLGKLLALPKEAVIDTGKRQIAFVDKGEGLFEPRKVVIGQRVEDYYEVREGLKEGEVVVTSANFLIDSESQLKGAISGMGGMEHKH